MTLKSLNTRYLLIRKMTVIGISLLLTAGSLLSPTRWCAEATGFNRRLVAAQNSIAALPGVAATPVLNEQKLTASDGALGDIFGDAVAASGSTIVVGARGDDNVQGAAYVFERHGGSWVETQKLTASDGSQGDQFSESVAISGSTIVVGAPIKNIDGNFAQGAVYVFERHGGSWVETQKLTASDGSVFGFFGNSVAVSGSTIVVGTGNEGAYVFNRHGGSWVETQKLNASDGAVGANFGLSVAISGSTIVVGASFADIGGTINQGAAYVFERQGRSWVETQKLTASDGAESDAFGNAVTISGSTIVVGASFDSIGGNLFQGSVYVFDRRGGGWVETQKLTASDGAEGDLFGNSVDISGSTIIAGSPNTSAAYVFNRNGGSWVETRKLTASDGAEADRFGNSVAVRGSTVVVGAPFTTIGGNFAQGSAYVFEP